MMTAPLPDVGSTPAAPGVPGAPPSVAADGNVFDFASALSDRLTDAAPAAGAAVERQAPAASGKAAPLTTPLVLAPSPDCELPDPDLLPEIGTQGQDEAKPEPKDAGELPEPSLEPALAWLMPPPVVVPPPPVGTAPPLPPALGADVAAKSVPVGPAAPTVAAYPGADLVDLPLPGPDQSPPRHFDARRNAPPIILVVPKAAKAATMPPANGVPPAAVAKAAAAAPIIALEPAAPSAPTSTDSAIMATSGPVAPGIVAAASSAQQAGIDLTRDIGMHRMIDRIEQLRDSADGRETRVRLIPDALGPVDISVRGEGDGVRIHFTTSDAATRQLILDAQPRLTELAEARGLRIERAIVDGGATGHGEPRPQPQHHQPTPRAPARAAREDAPESTDQRIA